MRGSLLRAVHGAGLSLEEAGLVIRAHDIAMEARVRELADDHHPAYLHPGRSALVLLRDVGPVTAVTLTAAILHETEDDGLRVDLERVRSKVGVRVAEVIESMPHAGEERLLERLVTLDEDARLAALAERLDQVRHLHLRVDLRPKWREYHDEAGAVWGPVAERTHPRLATRFRHWHTAFSRRLERSEGRGER
jgi:(p)ppGpp synthase/HD superfamily hydrolase